MNAEKLSRLEEAGIEVHKLLWKNVGDTDDWPIRIVCTDDEIHSRVTDALNELLDAVKEVRPEICVFPVNYD